MKKLLIAVFYLCFVILSAQNTEKIFHLDFENINAKRDTADRAAVFFKGNIGFCDGIAGKAMLFDGEKTSVYTRKASLKFDKEESFTVEFFIKPERKLPKGWSFVAVFNALRFAGRPHINSPFLFVVGNKKRLETIGTGTTDFNTGKWHHIALTRDTSKRVINYYCNGKLIKTFKETPEMTSAFAIPGEIYIGSAGSNGHYKGAIDEFVITNGVKTQFDLRELKRKNLTKQPPVKISKAIIESWEVLRKNKINLVPAPKQIKVTDGPFNFNAAEWSIDRKEKSDEPGYQYFIKRLGICGIKGRFCTDGKKKIIAGLYKDVAKLLSFQSHCPPRQGYILEVSEDKIIIAGTDEDGLRYGWLTLSCLLKENGKMFSAQISDYPDHKIRGGHYSPYLGNLESNKKAIDEAFVNRLNLLHTTRILNLEPLPLMVKEINDYAAERGIKCAITGVPSVGDIPNFRKVIPQGQDEHTYDYRTEEGIFGWKGHAISWSRDDLAETQAKKAVEYMKKYNFQIFVIHPVDAGGIDNPSRWNSRSEKCRKKWGGNFFAAHEHLIKLYCDTIKKHAPEREIFYVAYPYAPALLLNKEFSAHLKRLTDILGEDVKMFIREGSRSNMIKLNEITKNLYTVIYPFGYEYLNIHCNAGRYFTTFYHNGLDSMAGYEIWAPAGTNGHASRLTYTEYLWNHNAPGAANKPDGNSSSFEIITEYSPETDDELLPRACAMLYGEKAAEVMAKVFAAKLSECHSEHPFKVLPISVDQEKYFEEQVCLTDSLIKDMKNIKKFIHKDALMAWGEKYSYVCRVNFGAKVRLHCIRANKFADEGNFSEAQAEAEQGIALLKTRQAKAYRASTVLKNELNISEKLKSGAAKRIYAAKGKYRNIKIGFYQYAGTGKGGSPTAIALQRAFDGIGGIRTFSISDPVKSILKDIDVIIFSAINYVGDTSEDWRKNIRHMVEKDGKGVIFIHNSVGREKLANLGTPIFPEVCAGYAGRVADHPELTITSSTVFKGFLKNGSKYREEYLDHLTVIPGKAAAIVVKDEQGNAVAVIGKVGKGHVVYTGEIFAIDKKDTIIEPSLENWKMLYHLIRYASGE